MWALCLIHALLLSCFSAPTIEWRNRLNFLKVTPEYTYPCFQSQCVVYVQLPFHPIDLSHPVCSQHGHFYVGSTGISASKRDFNRAAKLKQLENDQAVHVELSMRYWLSNNNVPLFLICLCWNHIVPRNMRRFVNIV